MRARSVSGNKATAGWPLMMVLAALLVVVAGWTAACDGGQPAITRTFVTLTIPADNATTPTSPAFASLWLDAVPPEAFDTKQALEATAMPQRDLIDLTRRFGNHDQPIPLTARDRPWHFIPGDTHPFWILDWNFGAYQQVTATLAYQTDHVFVFVQDGIDVNGSQLQRLVDRFEGQTYLTSRRIFGREWSPGVDGDPRLTVFVGGPYGDFIGGYQHSLDEYASLVFPYSNEMEVIYVTPGGVRQGNDCLLAHEFTHLIQWANDRNETTWLNEGMAELACQVNGYASGNLAITLPAFAGRHNVQLNTWSGDMADAAAQYGATASFVTYLWERFGDGAIQALAAEPLNGLAGVEAVLRSLDDGLALEEFFGQWVAANILNDPAVGDGEYGYTILDLPRIDVADAFEAGDLPVIVESEVGQFAADYIQLSGPGAYQLEFTGATLVRSAPMPPHHGKYAWWSGRGHEGDVTLTGDFDLSGLQRATLLFDTWYDIEGGDTAHIAVSTDGRRWTALPGKTTVEPDRFKVNFGPGFSGESDSWIEEQVDLSPYTGGKIQLRFEYITDDGPVYNGIVIDDIRIPEIDFTDNVEAMSAVWVANGFIRLANVLPQEWLLQLITLQGDRVEVDRLELGTDNSGRWVVDLQPGETAILVVSGLTRVTTEPAVYAYSIRDGRQP